MNRREQLEFIFGQKLSEKDIEKLAKIIWGLKGLGKDNAPWELNSNVIEETLPRKELKELDELSEKYDMRKRRLR